MCRVSAPWSQCNRSVQAAPKSHRMALKAPNGPLDGPGPPLDPPRPLEAPWMASNRVAPGCPLDAPWLVRPLDAPADLLAPWWPLVVQVQRDESRWPLELFIALYLRN